MKKCLLGVAVLISGLSTSAQPTDITAKAIEIEVRGQVLRAGKQKLPSGSRIFDAVLSAQVRRDAYLLGAAWYTQTSQLAQAKLKRGLLFDLDQFILEAQHENHLARTKLAQRLKALIEQMPVTGRGSISLDPVLLELEPQHNRPLSPGDLIVYPDRPSSVRILGATQTDCILPFEGLRTATGYLHDCPRHPEADPDWLWIIQPDGTFQRLGIGPWNEEPAQALAPGATLLVPLRKLYQLSTDAFNAELAQFIATQPLPEKPSLP